MVWLLSGPEMKRIHLFWSRETGLGREKRKKSGLSKVEMMG